MFDMKEHLEGAARCREQTPSTVAHVATVMRLQDAVDDAAGIVHYALWGGNVPHIDGETEFTLQMVDVRARAHAELDAKAERDDPRKLDPEWVAFHMEVDDAATTGVLWRMPVPDEGSNAPWWGGTPEGRDRFPQLFDPNGPYAY